MNTVPKLRFSEDINEWTKGKATDLFDVLNGYAFKSRDSVNSGVPWVKIADVGVGKMKSASLSYLPDGFRKKYLKFSLTKGDFVLALTRPVLSNRLKIAKIGSVHHNGLLNQRVGKISSKEDAEFVNQILQRSSIVRMIEIQIAGTDPPNLAPSDFENIKIYYPSLPEQKKIADFLGAVDEKLRLLRDRHDALTDYKKGIMQKIFTQTLRFKADDGSDFPDWEKKRFYDLFSIGSGRDYKHLHAGDVPVYGTGGLMTHVDEYLYEGDSVGIGRKGTIDKPVYLTGKFWTVDTLFYTHSFKGIIPSFLLAIFQRENWQKHNEASGVPSLSKSTIEGLTAFVPVLEEQSKIADFLFSLDKKLELVSVQISQIQKFKKGLLQQMFV